MHIEPTRPQAEQFAAAAAAAQPEPVFMLNLLRFREQADGVDAGSSGAEAYGRYAAATGAHLARVGAEIVWAGACSSALIGPEEGEWHLAAVVRYPSRAAFLEMVGDADYQQAAKHRSAGLADSRLIPCASASNLG